MNDLLQISFPTPLMPVQNSSATADIKLLSADALTKWLKELLTNGAPEEVFVSVANYGSIKEHYRGDWQHPIGAGYTLAVPRQIFWSKFEEWVKQTGTRHVPDVNSRKKLLKEKLPSLAEKQVVELDRAYCFCFQNLPQCRTEFADWLGAPVSALFTDA
jgi:hypothetical protein